MAEWQFSFVLATNFRQLVQALRSLGVRWADLHCNFTRPEPLQSGKGAKLPVLEGVQCLCFEFLAFSLQDCLYWQTGTWNATLHHLELGKMKWILG